MWKKISSKKIFSHPRLTLIEDEVVLPCGIKTKYLKFEDNGDQAATIIAKRSDGKILLQKEYSYPSNQELFQFPGGKIPAKEELKKGANRELMEEGKYRAKNLKLLGYYLINNRRSAKKMHVYLATNLQEKSLEGDVEEEIKSFWFSESKIDKMIRNNKIINAHVLASWSLYKAKNDA